MCVGNFAAPVLFMHVLGHYEYVTRWFSVHESASAAPDLACLFMSVLGRRLCVSHGAAVEPQAPDTTSAAASARLRQDNRGFPACAFAMHI